MKGISRHWDRLRGVCPKDKAVPGLHRLLIGLMAGWVIMGGDPAGPDAWAAPGTPQPPGCSLNAVLVAPESSGREPLASGEGITLGVLFTNACTGALPVPGAMDLDLVSEDSKSQRVAAERSGPLPGPVPSGGFFKADFRFDMPAEAIGPVRIRGRELRTNTVVIYAAVQAKKQVAKMETETKPITSFLPKFQPFFGNFYPYKPVYFLFGADPGIEATSFQFSFKYKLFNVKETEGKHRFNPLDKVFFAYTQQSFWDLRSDSAPFEDSRYMPEIFYDEDDLKIPLPFLIGSGLRAGFQHESNGRGGDNSRSTNYAYIQPVFAFRFGESLYMKLAPKAWAYVRNDDDTNGDLADYRGYFDIDAQIGDPQGLALGHHFRHGKKGESFQFDLSYPLNQIPGFKWVPDMYIHAQYYSGYSEQLLKYDQREDIFRLGFSLVR